MSADRPQAAVLFSGGARSVLAAIRAGIRFERVQLLTFVRRGLVGREAVAVKAEELNRFFGDPHRFSLSVVAVDGLFRKLVTERYWRNLRQRGVVALSLCGPCKLSFHWSALAYGIEHRIPRFIDGIGESAAGCSTQFGAPLPAQLGALYRAFDLEYRAPLYTQTEDVGDALDQLGFRPRGQRDPSRPLDPIHCRQHSFDKLVGRRLVNALGQPTKRARVSAFYDSKIELIQSMTRDWVERRRDTELQGLLVGKP